MDMREVKEFLGRLQVNEKRIARKLEEMEQIDALSKKVTTTLKPVAVFTSGGNSDKVGDAVAKMMDLQNELQEEIAEYTEDSRRINELLKRVADQDEYDVLHYKYIGVLDEDTEEKKWLTWDEVAEQMHMSRRNACYIHGRALKTVRKLMDEEEQ